LDLGTGTGIHSFFACHAGAAKVYAVESDTIIELAKIAARKHGYENKIKFIQGDSRRIKLPEKVDVVITYLSLLYASQVLSDASKRFMKKRANCIPFAAELLLVPLEFEHIYREKIEMWPKKVQGLNFEFIRDLAVQCPEPAHFEQKNFIAEPRPIATVEFTKPFPQKIAARLIFKIKRHATLHGFGYWYGYRLSRKVKFFPQRNLEQIFLPLRTPLKLKKNDWVRVELEFSVCKFVPGGLIWNWRVEAGGQEYPHSSFEALPLSFKNDHKIRGSAIKY